MSGHSDVIVIGGGHNGLVAALLLARAGRSVRLLERAPGLGGASVSKQVFPGQPARLSQYSYLVSLLPDSLAAELGLNLELRSRAVSSYTPVRDTGLLVEREPGAATEASFHEVTGSGEAWRAWQRFYARVEAFAEAVGPALEGPLRRRTEVRDRVTALAGALTWDDFIERPLAEVLEREFADDLVRGVVATDGLIGVDTSLHSPELGQNRCFLYHVTGNSSGEWRVPVGGMGALSERLADAVRAAGVEVHTGAEVAAVAEDTGGVTVSTVDGQEFAAGHVLAAVAPAVLDRLLGKETAPPEGSQLKVNLLLTRLPRLRSGADPRQAFAGTLHLGESYTELEAAHTLAAQGQLANPLPCEVYCHSLTDPSILGPLAADGHHTLTLFGLHAPARLFRDGTTTREAATAAALAALQAHLAEPLTDVLATDRDGNPCVQAATPLDLEHDLGMPGGHIFHGELSWPWLSDDEPADTPAQRWGVAVTGHNRVLLAGAGTRRGGGVSGLGGVAAARAVTCS
ncbi:phytoene dehydrogenase-like protein [Crossiella equi]|uniref:Pyridine nucleotide-disulfide oxidoreductase domain-containing protein 2 n=1 Tax=Crossiella equi TaxID=130796 RepID=A0ABS5AKD9_9PSEU|nr:NAD(P)/FAD-dependent oxidoreductase [Crossiella equi]MBP2477041.1 phytoene dehydrogenase-like protein [Crossiella equi]